MEDNISLAISQFTSAWRIMCQPAPECSIAALSGMECTFSCLPVPFFNVVVVTERVDSASRLADLGRQAKEWADNKGVPWFFITTSEALSDEIDAAAVMAGAGFAAALPLTGMVAHDVPPLSRVPDGLQIAEPHDDPSSGAVVSLNGAAYGMDLEPARSVLGSYEFWKHHTAAIGSIDGKPASCSAVMIADGYRYVACVATHPDFQRRGFADAVMRRSLELSAAKHGAKPSFLHATDAGRPIYERMGYSVVSSHTLFLDQKFVQEH